MILTSQSYMEQKDTFRKMFKNNNATDRRALKSLLYPSYWNILQEIFAEDCTHFQTTVKTLQGNTSSVRFVSCAIDTIFAWNSEFYWCRKGSIFELAVKLLAGSVFLHCMPLLVEFSLREQVMALHNPQLMAVGMCPWATKDQWGQTVHWTQHRLEPSVKRSKRHSFYFNLYSNLNT